MMKRFAFFIVLAALMIQLAGCGGNAAQETEEETKVPVTVKPIELGNIEQSLVYQGDIKAQVEVNVFSKIPDRIARFYVDEGDKVKKGDPIATITATSIEQGVRQAEAGLRAAEAQLNNMKGEYERSKRLFNEGAVSAQQFDQVETQYKALQAQLEQAQAALKSAKSGFDDATVTASIFGMIGKRFMEEGDMASPSMPLVTIVQDNRMQLEFEAAEQDLGKLAQGQTALVRVRSFPDKVFKGVVDHISPVLDPMTRMATVEVLIDNPDRLLRSGMFARVEIIVGKINDTIIVPRFATIENTHLERNGSRNKVTKEYFVFVANDSLALKRKLDVQYVNHVNLAVQGGIDVGELLIIEGQNNLRDSTAIAIVKEEAAL